MAKKGATGSDKVSGKGASTRASAAKSAPAIEAGDPVLDEEPAPAERDPDTDDMFGGPPAAAATAAARPYVVLARKYRPQTFDDLIGQEAMVTTLRNAFATDRIAQAYMLTGVRGVGKTTTARILARALNFSLPGKPGKATIDLTQMGEHCAAIMESRHPDVIEMDAASNTGVDNVREIIEGARYKPVSARHKVYIIDEVHMLSRGAFNALLKTLEEPPEHVKFVFATTEIRKVPVTVLSRCQRFDLRRVGADLLLAHFERVAEAEGVTAEKEALASIARAAEGSVRDGLSMLDQAIAMGSGKVQATAVRAMLGLADRSRVFDLIEATLGGDAAGSLERLGALHKDGAEPLQLLGDLAETVHLAARAKAAGPDALGETLTEVERQRAAALAQRLGMPALARAWQMLLKGLDEAARAPNPLAAAEMLLIRMAYMADLPTPGDVLRGDGAGAGTSTRAVAAGAGGAGSSGARPRGAGATVPEMQDEVPAVSATTGSHAASPVAPSPPLDTFADVIALIGARRDARLKVLVEEHVSLVRYEPGQIEIHLLPGAPRELANELREKLNAWTGRKWMIALSKSPGAKSIGEAGRERSAAALEAAMRDPLLQDMLKHFPDAEIVGVQSFGDDAGVGAVPAVDPESDAEPGEGTGTG
jgi:DNA polymerase-3 subunit gamma/tau